MTLIDSFVRNPVKVAVGVLLVALFGFVALLRMPMQLTPEVQTPTITVETAGRAPVRRRSSGRSSIEQEEQLKSVEGVTKMTSESTDSHGHDHAGVRRRHRHGRGAASRSTAACSRCPSIPEDADQPVITTANAIGPADRLVHSQRASCRRTTEFDAFASRSTRSLAEKLADVPQDAQPGWRCCDLRNLAKEHPEVNELLPPPELDVTKLRRFAEDEIEARFERVAGVSQSNVIGGLEDEMQVVVDPREAGRRGRSTIRRRPPRAARPERRHVGRRLLGRQAALGGADAGPVPLARAGREPAAGRARRRAGLCARRGRGAAGLQEAGRTGAPLRRIEHRRQLPSAKRVPTCWT